MRRTAAIVGAGLTEVGKVYGRTASSFAAEAVRLAVADAGLVLGDLDGLLVNAGMSGDLDVTLARRLGLRDLRLLSQVNAYGASAGIMVAQAAAAVLAGDAEVVACVFADAPRQQGATSGETYRRSSLRAVGFRSAETASGFRSVNHRDPPAPSPPRASAASTPGTPLRRAATWPTSACPRTTSAPSPSASAPGRSTTRPRNCAPPSRSRTTTGPAGSSNRCTCSTAAWSPTAGQRSWSRRRSGRPPSPSPRSTCSAGVR